MNQYEVQALELQFSEVALGGFNLKIHQPLLKTLFLPNQILILYLMSTEESRQKKFHFWPGMNLPCLAISWLACHTKMLLM